MEMYNIMEKMKYSFKNDYSEGAHPNILNALANDNLKQVEAYGLDDFCNLARKQIYKHINNPEADIHFISGGTQANLIVIASVLKDYEAVISADTGHINVHETGAIEYTGHKIISVPSKNGKITPTAIQKILDAHTDEHLVKPKLVFISNSTEVGTIYKKNELETLSVYCKANNLILYLDGARLAMALSSKKNDLTLAELSNLVDMFYIGGTKNGGMFGETIIINNKNYQENFRFHLKQKGALPAKGRYFGIQFNEFFKDNLYFVLGQVSNGFADKVSKALEDKSYKFLVSPETNQLFPILPNTLIAKLLKEFDFYIWEKYDDDNSVVRLVFSWATKSNYVDKFISRI